MIHLTDAVGIGLTALASGLYWGFIWGWRWAEKARDGLARWNEGYAPTEATHCEQHELVEGGGGLMRWCRWCPYTEAPAMAPAKSIAAMAPRKPATVPSPAPATTLADTASAALEEAYMSPYGHCGCGRELLPNGRCPAVGQYEQP